MIVIQSSDDEDKRLKRREKNRVAAQRSRKRQTQRADELHEVCKLHFIYRIQKMLISAFALFSKFAGRMIICPMQTYDGNCGQTLENI